ncbi:thap domain protein [Anaeramoeba flamelloides]|uniref:Thap domain protein n=1 Tax=Anaeramoeba flamelloides TaxID=1746091 RepID=A0ABQ8YBR0_9EUKA|nr:thap domain protein [Anaeramoeba flamelloides]
MEIPNQWRNREPINVLQSESEEDDEDEDEEINHFSWENIQRLNDEEGRRTITGYTGRQLNNLWTLVEPSFRFEGKGKRRKILNPQSSFIMLLVWLRHYEIFKMLAPRFNLKYTWAHDLIVDTIYRIHDILVNSQVHFIHSNIQRLQGWRLDDFPNVIAIVDTTVQQISRPVYHQEDWYDGKHKCHSIKTQTINAPNGLVMHYNAGLRGPIHDKRVWGITLEGDVQHFFHQEMQMMNDPPEVLADKAYLGVNQVTIIMPYRGQRRNLTEEEIEFNQKVSRHRVIIEQFYGRLKNKFRAIGNKWRHDKGEFYIKTMGVAISLINWEIRNGHPLNNNF